MNKNNTQYKREDIEKIKNICNNWYLSNKKVRIKMPKDRKRVIDSEAIITGVYPRFMTINYFVNNNSCSVTVAYTDILIGNVIVEEL